MYCVTVTFQIKTDQMDAFLLLMQANAQTSLSVEPDCHHFDVCIDPTYPTEVFLYELYTDRAAFDVHLTSDHFKIFDAKVAQMIAKKTVRSYDTVL